MQTKKEIIEKNWPKPSQCDVSNIKAMQETIDKMMDEWAKLNSIAFQEYHRRYRHEEGVFFKRECDRTGGMFTMAYVGVSFIYEKFKNEEEIKSVSMPGVIYKFPVGEELIVILPEKFNHSK